MKISICDDNEIYLKYLHNTIHDMIGDYNDTTIVALTPNELLLKINQRELPYDIIITDIDMGNINGIQLAEKIMHINSFCIIIFISNYINFATEVYDVEHTYFVLKSEAKNRLPKALDKAFKVIQDRKVNYLTFSYQKINYRILLTDILYIEALGRYLYIHTKITSYKCISSLKVISSDLTNSFARCHNSFIVNLDHVHSLSRTVCVLTTESTIPISYTYAKTFNNAYINFVSQKL